MGKKSKNAAAAAAEPPPKKSKNAGAAVCEAAEVAGGEGGPRGAYRDAFQIGDEVSLIMMRCCMVTTERSLVLRAVFIDPERASTPP